jgi:hypothetical protein
MAAKAHGWIKELLRAVLQEIDLGTNAAIHRDFPPILAALDPEPGAPAHDHLKTDGVAFANRSTLRDAVGRMTQPNGPRTLVLRGNALSGTSYAWRLINHVARDSGVERVHIDFAKPGDHRPLGVGHALAAQMGLSEIPQRADNPSDAQLAIWLVQWFTGKLRLSGKTWWIVFDNAQRPTVPPETREMIVAFVQALADGMIDTARLFVLGFGEKIGDVNPTYGYDMPLQPIGRGEIVAYLEDAKARLGGLPGDFVSTDEVADEILLDFDPQAPCRESLEKVSEQLTLILSEMGP